MSGEGTIALRTPPLPYYLGSGMSLFHPGDQHPNRRGLGFFDLLLVAKGTLHIGENGKEWALGEGETLLLQPEGEHYAVKPCEEETAFYWVHFEHAGMREGSAEEAIAVTPSSGRQPFANPHAVRLPKRSVLRNPAASFGLLEELFNYSGENRQAAFWREQTLLLELLRQLEEGAANRTASPSYKLAAQTEAYLKQYYRSELTNESVAEALHFHPNYIVRCMKEHYGRTPMDYLQAYRLEQAKRLLVATDWPIGRIAEEVGFRYAPYFSSCFKANEGLPPLRFRKMYRT
ncbi:AraC family transcriptional regulator [Cohnella lubricantis]|uniref:AraC family transcriptional regulator n=1 Tax=Cohnella lubricantis TaxID=2163172 RepID=A0A841TIA5_9BACL|nr:AraC family transcriptional regulator [Cohnella lubricantis]MBB6678960.1 AraC family transcriptional regulator [Cohnella lubricantis]MBP2118821.1 AraC-like DNA-binding protein [Cohnella lubricantis]